jgi:hypothetical protein
MFLSETYLAALFLMILTMLCLGVVAQHPQAVPRLLLSAFLLGFPGFRL